MTVLAVTEEKDMWEGLFEDVRPSFNSLAERFAA
jgi:hypothetical protein